MQRDCNPRERRFVEEYLIDLNARRAAIAAGYAPRTAKSHAHSWAASARAKPHVFHAIEQAKAARARRTEITADRVLTELARIGFADIRKAAAWRSVAGADAEAEPRGRRTPSQTLQLLDSDALDDDTAAAIAEISQTTTGLKIKMHDKRAALVDIAKHLGLFVSRSEIGRPGAFDDLSLEQKRERAVALAQELGLGRLEFDAEPAIP